MNYDYLTCLFDQYALTMLMFHFLFLSYFHLNLSVLAVYEYVLGDNSLIAFDAAFCLILLLDMVAEAVSINMIRASHAKLLLDEELHRSFTLNSTALNSTTSSSSAISVDGSERSINDSLSQLRIVREKLQATALEERLCIYSVPLDVAIVNSIKTLIFSYAVVAVQTLFSKNVLKEHPKH